MYEEIGAVNCSFRNAPNPCLWTFEIRGSVAPKVACARKRPASWGVGVPEASGGGGGGTGAVRAPTEARTSVHVKSVAVAGFRHIFIVSTFCCADPPSFAVSGREEGQGLVKDT